MKNKNFTIHTQLNQQLMTHLNKLQDRYSKILPIRIDIHYAKDDKFNTNIHIAKQEITCLLFQAMQFELDIVGVNTPLLAHKPSRKSYCNYPLK